MSFTKNQTCKSEKSIPQQSDITIAPDGTVHISFLWEDLQDVPQILSGQVPAPLATSQSFGKWKAPEVSISQETLDEYSRCRLCPKQCGFDRVRRHHPTCGDFQLRIGTYGLSQGDEPEIRGTRGSGAILLSGCPLKCVSCHNPEKVANGSFVSAQGFVNLCAELQERGAHNIQILSPTVHLPALRHCLSAMKSSGFPIPIVFKSSGYESVEQLRMLEGLIDIYLPDFKFGSCSQWSKRSGVANYFEKAQLALKEMIRQVGDFVTDEDGIARRGILIRHVESPLPPEEKAQIRSFLKEMPKGVRISYQDNFVMLE